MSYVSWFSIKRFFHRLLKRGHHKRVFISDAVGFVDYQWRRCSNCGTCFHTLIYRACPMHGEELNCGHPEDSFGGCPLPRWRVPKA